MLTGGGPLAGVRVVEFAGIGPVPFAGTMLRQLGAAVTRIERPHGIDSIIPVEQGRVTDGKDIVELDLKQPSAVGELLELIRLADVLLEGHRPGVMERLGLGPEVCLERNSKLVYGRMTGWGQDGPLAQRAGHDLNYIALTGALHAIGEAGGPPQIPLNLIGDYGGGALYLLVGVLAALHEVSAGGKGQVVDAAIVDGVAHMLSGVHAALAAGLWRDERGANFMDGGSPYYCVYPTADGRYMSVTAVEPKFYAQLLGALQIDEDPARQQDVERWPILRGKLTQAFAQRTQAEWVARLQHLDACAAPVLSLTEAPAHPHLAARGTVVNIDGRLYAGPAPRFSNWSVAKGE